MTKPEIAKLTLVEPEGCAPVLDGDASDATELGFGSLEEQDWEPESPPGTAARQDEAMCEMERRAALRIAEVRRTALQRRAMLRLADAGTPSLEQDLPPARHEWPAAPSSSELLQSAVFAVPAAQCTSAPPDDDIQSRSGADVQAAILHFEDALQAISRHDYGQALLLLEKAMSLDPDNRLYQANYRRALARQDEVEARTQWDLDPTGTC